MKQTGKVCGQDGARSIIVRRSEKSRETFAIRS